MILPHVNVHRYRFERMINHLECLIKEYLEMILICYSLNVFLTDLHPKAE